MMPPVKIIGAVGRRSPVSLACAGCPGWGGAVAADVGAVPGMSGMPSYKKGPRLVFHEARASNPTPRSKRNEGVHLCRVAEHARDPPTCQDRRLTAARCSGGRTTSRDARQGSRSVPSGRSSSAGRSAVVGSMLMSAVWRVDAGVRAIASNLGSVEQDISLPLDVVGASSRGGQLDDRRPASPRCRCARRGSRRTYQAGARRSRT